MKKLFYILCIVASVVIIGILVYQRIVRQRTQVIPQNAQTIIPVAPQLQQQETSASEVIPENIMQSGITLLSDEVLVDEVQVDVNGDNKEDKIIAAKKLSDQFIYLFIFLQENEAQTFTRAAEIKTEATHAKTLSVYTLMVQEYPYPIIAYNGMNADTMQVFGMYALEIDEDKIISVRSLAGIQADGQIILKNEQDNSISDYTISAYYSDKDAPNTLNQIEKQYTWNAKKEFFVQTKEIKIPGKRIESQFLQKFQTGDAHAFQEFLDGLWYQPSAKRDQNRSIFFNRSENEIIFSVDNIQELFTIDSITPRRFGIYFSTKNASISSIHRRINIELLGIDEVHIRVIDDIARLKIGVASNWDGTYRKISNTVREVQSNTTFDNIKKILTADEKTWTSTEGYSLSFSDNSYRLLQDTVQQSGWYTILQIKDNTILQLKDTENNERFFNLILDNAGKRLSLIEVSVTLSGITPIGKSPLVFE
ncbi:pallilysin-related adhesin [Treponema vincentii]|uniref:pallilysin-related adhesin n=1 Tax=Treponema vincentii TaxID=69710 RepID=UPI001BAEE7D4|nr:pallilysin-related adhesin [Treponema vincentii]QUY17894.1 pallilysin-related adhesin [Treponema vincentii]